MFDNRLRRATAPALATTAGALHRLGVPASWLTVAGLGLGLGAATGAATGRWWVALGLWLGSRLVDGLDGPVARLEGTAAWGGFADLMADFTVYAAFVAGVAIEVPDARLAAVVLLCTYYLSATAFLGWSSAAAASGTGDGLAIDDDRTVRFVGGLAEGFETIVAYSAVCLFPDEAEAILWVFAALVAVTALQRVIFAVGDLRDRDRRHDANRQR